MNQDTSSVIAGQHYGHGNKSNRVKEEYSQNKRKFLEMIMIIKRKNQLKD